MQSLLYYVRKVSDKITVLVDTKDPEIRITEVNKKTWYL